jgi:hypothetical protein
MNLKTTVAASIVFVGSLTGTAFASDADFTLVNKTGYQIDDVYVSPAKVDEWGKDIMGKDALADGEKVDITVPHGDGKCKFDIKVKYNDGDSAEWGDVDLCEYNAITLHWDGKNTTATGE